MGLGFVTARNMIIKFIVIICLARLISATENSIDKVIIVFLSSARGYLFCHSAFRASGIAESSKTNNITPLLPTSTGFRNCTCFASFVRNDDGLMFLDTATTRSMTA